MGKAAPNGSEDAVNVGLQLCFQTGVDRWGTWTGRGDVQVAFAAEREEGALG